MRKRSLCAALLVMSAALAVAAIARADRRMTEVDLVSDIAGRAAITDANLVNPWGTAVGPTGVIWVSDNGTGVSTLYDPTGAPRPLVVTIPGGAPTGQVFNPSDSAFVVSNGDSSAKALFIFVTEHGGIYGWNPALGANQAFLADSDADANYKGLAIAQSPNGWRLYGADFHDGTINVYDEHFNDVEGGFVDPNLPAGYSPFNVQNIDGQIYVAYALRDSTTDEEVPGAGLGIVDIYDTSGNLIRRFVTGGELNAPWGMTLAPPGFNDVGGDILIGNFGNGQIDAYDRATGNFVGALQDSVGATLAIEGLWALWFRPLAAGAPPVLFFTAGIDDENHGLLGYLHPTTAGPPPPPPPGACDTTAHPIGAQGWALLCGRHASSGDGGEGDDEGGDGHGHGHGHGHGPGGGAPTDSLQALFNCVSSQVAAFGPNGCLTASCDLLHPRMNGDPRTRLGRQFLALLLNRCAGRVCDSVVVRCTEDVDDDDQGDDDGDRSALPVLNVGQLVARIDSALCSGGDRHSLHRLALLAACANAGAGGGEDSGDNDAQVTKVTRLRVLPLAPNPVRYLQSTGMRFRISTQIPTTVQLGIYDAAGRLVAQPLRGTAVSGTSDVHWDGLDVHGRLVAPGTYFYRATAGRDAATGRIVIMR